MQLTTEARRHGVKTGFLMLHEQQITEAIIGAAIEVHRELGPGLLESAYEECFCHELHLRGLSFQRQVELPVAYKGLKLDCGYRLDVVVDNAVHHLPVAIVARRHLPAGKIFAIEQRCETFGCSRIVGIQNQSCARE